MLESGRELTDLPLFVDPADSIERAASENPETSKLAALLNAWIATFGTTPTSPAQAITKATEVFGAQSVLFDALDEIARRAALHRPASCARQQDQRPEALDRGAHRRACRNRKGHANSCESCAKLRDSGR